MYATQRLREVFQRIDARWHENWCACVVDALLDRLELSGLHCSDPAADEWLATLWDEFDLALDAEEIHTAVAVTHEGFLIVERDDEDNIRPYANPPYLVHAFYFENDPRQMEFAAKWWEQGEKTYLTLYYSDHLEHYVANKKRAEITDASSFLPDPDMPQEAHGYGEIPVFHFRRSRRSKKSELTDVVPLQDADNKLLADMMVAAEFLAFPQRWAIAHADTDTSVLKGAPNTVIHFPARGDEDGQDVEVGEFSAADLGNFLKAMDDMANKIATISRTPKHYLLQTGAEPSGEALLTQEAPLVKKAAKYQQRLSVRWRQATAFMLRLAGHEVPANSITPVWEDAHTVQPKTQSEIRLTNVKAGIPIALQLKREGWSEDEIDELRESQDDEQSRSSTIGDVARESALRNFNGGANAAPYPPVAE